jgi:AraC-like DNA-binding protein
MDKPTFIEVNRVSYLPGRQSRSRVNSWVFTATTAGQLHMHHPSNGLPDLVPGRVLLMRSGSLCDWTVGRGGLARNASPRWEAYVTLFLPRENWLHWLQFSEVQPGFAIFEPSRATWRRLLAGMRHAMKLAESDFALREDMAMNALERMLLECQEDRRARLRAVDSRVQLAIDHLSQNLARPLTLQQLSRVCHSSRARLASLFRSHVGIAPMAYRAQQRIHQARQLLASTDKPIEQIAGAVGYSDPKAFSKHFKRAIGVTPTQFRRGRQPR